MTSRLLAMFGLVSLMVGLASAQETKDEVKEKSTRSRTRSRRSLKVSGEVRTYAQGHLDPRGGPRQDDARRSRPTGCPVYLLGAMTVDRRGTGSDAESRAARLVSQVDPRRIAKLQSLYKDLAPNEKRFLLHEPARRGPRARERGQDLTRLFGRDQARRTGGGVRGLRLAGNRTRSSKPVTKLPEFKVARRVHLQAEARGGQEGGRARSSPELQVVPLRLHAERHRRQARLAGRLQGEGHDCRRLGDLVPPLPDGDSPTSSPSITSTTTRGWRSSASTAPSRSTPDQVKQTIKDFDQGRPRSPTSAW